MQKIGVSYISGMMGALVENPGEVKAGDAWAANLEKRDITYKRDSMEELSNAQIRGLTLHEIGHLKYTTNYHSEYEKTHKSQALHTIYNIMEDHRIEQKLAVELGDFGISALKELNNSITENVDFSKIKPYEAEILRQCISHDSIGITPHSGTFAKSLVERAVLFSYETGKKMEEPIERALKCKTFKEMVDIIDSDIAPLLDLEKDPDSSPEMLKRASANPKGRGKSSDDENYMNEDGDVSYYDAVAIMNPYVSVTAQRLSQVLKENSAVRFTGAKLSGKLLSKNTYKVALDERRIFSKRSQPDSIQYNVTVVIDNSGSMCGEKQLQAMRGAALIEGIAKKLSFPFQSWKYDDRPRKMKGLKDFEKACNGGNEECKMLANLLGDLKKSGQKTNNLVIIITDGQGDSRESMQPYIQDLVDNYGTTLLAIGIGGDAEDAADAYAPRGLHVPDAEQLPSAIINFMRKLIHR